MASVSHARHVPQLRLGALHVPILDIYLLSEIVGPFLFAFGAYFIFWALNIFFAAADYVINQHAPFFLVLRFVVFRVPQAIPMAFPFATLFSTLLALGRLMGDNEINAMRTSGISLARFSITPILFGITAFVVCWAMNEYVAPPSVDLSTRTFYQILYHTDSLPVEPLFFRRDPDTGNVFFVTNVGPDNKTMIGVQIFKPGHSGYWNETFQAKTASVDGSLLVLHDVVHSVYNPDGMVISQFRTKEARVGLPLAETAAQFVSNVNSDPWTMSSKTLATQVRSLQNMGMGGAALGNLKVSLANKFAWPFACVVGVLLSLPLALRFGKRGRTLGIAMAIIAFFIYFLMTSAAAAVGRNGAIDPYLAAWLPNIVMGGVGIVLLFLEER